MNTLTVTELNEASFLLIRLAQREAFGNEVSSLEKSKPICHACTILSLNPIIDNNGILRVGGRLSNGKLEFDQKHQIILPHNHKLTDLIILDAHLNYLHVGSQTLLSLLPLKFSPVRVLKCC